MKLKTLFLMMALSVCLAACGKDEAVVKAENDIAAMGEITLDSEDIIKAVEDYYNSLTEEQKSKVANANLIAEARGQLATLQEEEAKRVEALVAEGVELIRTNDVSNHEKALSLFEEADKAGNLDGTFMVGYTLDWILRAGKGQDFEKAKIYYEKALDNPYAMICLSNLYNYGQGVTSDKEKAKEYMLKAYNELVPDRLSEAESKAYNAEAMMLNGELLSSAMLSEENRDYAKAMEWYEKAAELGNANAMNNIGDMYWIGLGVEEDDTKAMEWFEKAVELGNANAMINIGYMYEDGLGVEQDYAKAMEWYEKAVELGNDFAMNCIGHLYYDGNGVEQDYTKAMEWFEKAAELGDYYAMSIIGFMYDKGLGVEQDDTKAMEWFEKAVELGNADAMNNIGNLYRRGNGVEQDYVKAKEWYQKAASLGNEYAKKSLKNLK